MINIEEIKSKLREIITPIVESSGAYLVDINLKGFGKKLTLEVFVDTDDGITVKKCEEISRRISDALDFHDLIPVSYRLEVSSPGVGNPFKVKRQYFTNIGRFVRVKYVDELSGQVREVLGQLIMAGDETIEIKIENDENLLVLKYNQIIEAKTEIVW
ncbi:ribosome maturation factor RimP [Candidatus Kryptobacter tengchongensis]|uniref:Ribosome maturation factor RimP n=1 Tax=Kryptobacter tengchongensis TaxID=1643429 RepID=A0A656D997_KRYT1|nr:ribosome maturation factor RimP [Candidatus Kryptobacter tengchongensis]CUS84738.1 ribosome maturation factor RimP [Candidatus Kryptobacter tengchongensis]CUT00683.1 ribosome maturation factor RimP [Candidatus Kryptobacter tengchongensis]CUT01905.1 ribosome maturation factor RimP [Candidatus Kryptobacter tengchongensis]CUU02375.1 ribosome maturation factor RimP [Candidatus Kryptobacter tengchongensis]